MKVLLIVDPQNDFCPGGAMGVEEADKIFPAINDLMEDGGFDLVVASQDWHPEGHESFNSLWPVHCVQGSDGAKFFPALNTAKLDFIVQKGTDKEVDSYSAFFDNEKNRETPLRAYLENEAAQRGETLEKIELYVCGLATDYCVKFTALDASSLGLQTKLIVDCCRAVNLEPGDDVKALRELVQHGVELTESRLLQPAGREPQVRSLDYYQCP